MARNKNFQLEGVNEVTRNLLRAGKIIQRNTQRGMKKAGLFLERKSNEIVPIQTGNLRGSSFVRASGSGVRFAVTIGYTASYAVFVHENLDAAHGSEFNVKHADKISRANVRLRRGEKRSPFFNRGPDQQAKFLERSARENRFKILRIIHKEATKPPRI